LPHVTILVPFSLFRGGSRVGSIWPELLCVAILVVVLLEKMLRVQKGHSPWEIFRIRVLCLPCSNVFLNKLALMSNRVWLRYFLPCNIFFYLFLFAAMEVVRSPPPPQKKKIIKLVLKSFGNEWPAFVFGCQSSLF
jgi:hypothetical protein